MILSGSVDGSQGTCNNLIGCAKKFQLLLMRSMLTLLPENLRGRNWPGLFESVRQHADSGNVRLRCPLTITEFESGQNIWGET